MNLNQINSIINHEYVIDQILVKSTTKIVKNHLGYAMLLFDLPEHLTFVKHLTINGTSFKPGVVIKIETYAGENYGVLDAIIEIGLQTGKSYLCIVQMLHIIKFVKHLNSYKVSFTQKTTPVSIENVHSKKVYSLWNLQQPEQDANCLYISLKYKD